MSEPPQTPPQPEDGDPRAPDAGAARPSSPDTPERPPPYQGVYGAVPGRVPAPPAGPPGQATPAAPPVPPGYGSPPVPPGTPAGRFARLGAGILDALLVSVAAMPVALFSIRWDELERAAESGEPVTDPLELYHIPRLLAGYLVLLALGFVYFTVLHAKWGQTLGKRAVGIRLVQASDLSAVTWGQAFGRQAFVYGVTVVTGVLNLLSPAFTILGFAGMLDNAWILWDERRQALHDKVARTVVVKAPPGSPDPYARRPAPETADDPGKI